MSIARGARTCTDIADVKLRACSKIEEVLIPTQYPRFENAQHGYLLTTSPWWENMADSFLK